MFEFALIIILVCAVLLIVVVLAQNPKGGGLSEQFGGSSSSQLIGVKRTGDLLEKLTWGLLVAMFVMAFASHQDSNIDRIKQAQWANYQKGLNSRNSGTGTETNDMNGGTNVDPSLLRDAQPQTPPTGQEMPTEGQEGIPDANPEEGE